MHAAQVTERAKRGFVTGPPGGTYLAHKPFCEIFRVHLRETYLFQARTVVQKRPPGPGVQSDSVQDVPLDHPLPMGERHVVSPHQVETVGKKDLIRYDWGGTTGTTRDRAKESKDKQPHARNGLPRGYITFVLQASPFVVYRTLQRWLVSRDLVSRVGRGTTWLGSSTCYGFIPNISVRGDVFSAHQRPGRLCTTAPRPHRQPRGRVQDQAKALMKSHQETARSPQKQGTEGENHPQQQEAYHPHLVVARMKVSYVTQLKKPLQAMDRL